MDTFTNRCLTFYNEIHSSIYAEDNTKEFCNLFISQQNFNSIFNNLKDPLIENNQNKASIALMNRLYNEILNLFSGPDNNNQRNGNNRIEYFNNEKISNFIDNNININKNVVINIGKDEELESDCIKNIGKNNNGRKRRSINILQRKRERKNQKGRKKKTGNNSNYNNNSISPEIFVHNRDSKDNMIRKIKNKVFDSAYNFLNYCIKKDEEKNGVLKKNKIEIYRIKGIYGQEVEITFNLYLILQQLKEIFSYNISTVYDNKIKTSNINKEIIKNIYSDKNKDIYINTKKVLEMTFYEYYHKIFLNEDNNIFNELGVKKDEYSFRYYKNLIQENIKNTENSRNLSKEDNNYLENVEKLAKNYENYFIQKQKRQSKKQNKINSDNIIYDIQKKCNCNELKEKVQKIINDNIKIKK
jgi:hypothetical protein